MVKRPLIQIAYSLGLSARFAPPMAIERGTLIGLDRFLEIGIGNNSTGPGSGCSRFRATRVLGKRPHSERVSGLCEGDLTRAMIAATVCTEPMQFLGWGKSADAAREITLSLPLGLLLALPFDLPIAYSGCRGDGF